MRKLLMIGLLLAATTAQGMDESDRRFTFALAKAKACADMGRQHNDGAMTWVMLNLEHDLSKISTGEIMGASEGIAETLKKQKEYTFDYCVAFTNKYASKYANK